MQLPYQPSPMSFAQAKAMAQVITGKTKAATEVLQSFPKGAMGLTPDHVKFSPEFCAANAAFHAAFMNERRFNAWYTKAFKKELLQDRDKRRAPQAATL